MGTRRNQRALAVIRTLRQKQSKQHQQIGILCEDMVTAHGKFAQKISRLNFVTGFYEALLGSGDLETLLDTAAVAIQARVPESSVAIFVLEKQGFDIHIVSVSDEGLSLGREQFQQWFTTEAVNNISLAGQVCSAERMLTSGMQASPALLKRVSIAAVPLGILGRAVGFVLIWRKAEKALQRHELESVAAVASGLRAAVLAYRGASDTKPHVSSLTVNNKISS